MTHFNQQEEVRLYLDNMHVTCNQQLPITSKNMYLNKRRFQKLINTGTCSQRCTNEMITKQIMSSRVGPNDIQIILIFLVNYKKCLLKFYYLHYSIEIYLVNVLKTCTLRLVSETLCVLYTYLSIGVRFLSIYQLFKWKKSGEQANNYVENTMKLQQPSAYI